MKFVIDQYSTNFCSQPEYIARAIQQHEEHEVFVNDFTIPVFDFLDRVDPDVYITHVSRLSRDVVYYIKESKKDIHLFICNDNSKYGTAKKTFENLVELGVKHRVFSNQSGFNKISFTPKNTISLLPATELNLLDETMKWNKEFDMLVVADSKEKLQESKCKINAKYYHVLPLDGLGDISATAGLRFANLAQNYKEILFTEMEKGVDELFFQSLLYGNKVYFYSDMNADKIDDMLKRILKIEDTLDYTKDNKLQDFSKIKTIVKEKHSSQQRLKTILSQLPQRLSC